MRQVRYPKLCVTIEELSDAIVISTCCFSACYMAVKSLQLSDLLSKLNDGVRRVLAELPLSMHL